MVIGAFVDPDPGFKDDQVESHCHDRVLHEGSSSFLALGWSAASDSDPLALSVGYDYDLLYPASSEFCDELRRRPAT